MTFKYVIDKTEGDPTYAYFNASTQKLWPFYLYMKLVDTFGDVPYAEALRGSEGLVTPAYDDLCFDLRGSSNKTWWSYIAYWQ